MNTSENIKNFGLTIKNCEDCDKCPLGKLYISCGAICCVNDDNTVTNDLKRIYASCKDFIEIIDNYKSPILDEVEKEYLTNIVKPYVRKYDVRILKTSSFDSDELEYIEILLWDSNDNEDSISFPYFRKDTMYKGMELERGYSLDELGITF